MKHLIFLLLAACEGDIFMYETTLADGEKKCCTAFCGHTCTLHCTDSLIQGAANFQQNGGNVCKVFHCPHGLPWPTKECSRRCY